MVSSVLVSIGARAADQRPQLQYFMSVSMQRYSESKSEAAELSDHPQSSCFIPCLRSLHIEGEAMVSTKVVSIGSTVHERAAAISESTKAKLTSSIIKFRFEIQNRNRGIDASPSTVLPVQNR